MTAVLVAIVGGATLAGDFDWRQPGLAHAMGQGRASSGEGSLDPMLIKGSTSLAEISEATGVPAEELGSVFGVPAEALDKPLKEIKDVYGFTPEDVRVWLETRLQQ